MLIRSIFSAPSPAQLWDRQQRLRRKQFIKVWKPWEDIQAGSILIPENSAHPHGRKISLTYTVIRKKNKKVSSAPILVLTGGPGISSLQAVPFWIASSLRDEHDLILLDQRGTDFSAALPDISPDLFDIMAQDLSPGEDCRKVRRLMQSFIQQPIFKDLDLRSYHVYQSAKDVIQLMNHLGYEDYHLLGLSHGTKLASIVMDRAPSRIKSSVLYGPWTTCSVFFKHLPGNFSQAWDWFRFQDVMVDSVGCLQQILSQVMEQLDKKQMLINVKGKPFSLTSKDVLFLIRYFLYFPDAVKKIPAFLEAIQQKDIKQVQDLCIRPFHMMCGKVNLTTYAASLAYDECDPASIEEFTHACRTNPLFETGLAFFPTFIRHLSTWKEKEQVAVQKDLQANTIPALIMVHAGDPVTPPWQGKRMQQKLLNSELFQINECGHVYLDQTKFEIMNEFF